MAESRKLRVFLCHSSQDKPTVRELYQKLGAEGWIAPWLDEEELLPGQDWDYEIEKALDASDAVIVTLTTGSVNKEGYVQKELRFVLDIALEKPEGTIFILPVRLDECERPRRLRPVQGVDYFPPENRERAYARLRRSLEIRATGLGIATASQEQVAESSRSSGQAPAAPAVEREEPKAAPRTEVKQPPPMQAAKKGGSRAKRRAGPLATAVADLAPSRKEWGGIEFCRVPAGKFLMGSSYRDKGHQGDEKPQHGVDIPYDYWLARFPVTNEQYAAYVDARGGHHPVSSWKSKRDHPVVDVSWNDAMAYCAWLNDLLKGELPAGLGIRMPTEAEWEKAARWRPDSGGRGDGNKGESLIYPWGNEFDESKCNITGLGGGTTSVGAYSPGGDSPCGCADMAGNVWEWTHSLYKPYPYSGADGREDEKATGARVVRGGSWSLNRYNARCACRHTNNPDSFNHNFGFRVVLSPD